MRRAGAAQGATVLVHGGAGDVPEDRRDEHVRGCQAAARAGHEVLARGGSALDAVQAAARSLEDCISFNAGTGAALNEEGDVEHDAALMDGAALRAGAVAALRAFANPIDVARAVLDEGRHVLLVAEGAAAFARTKGIASVAPALLVSDRAREVLARVLAGNTEKGWAGGTIGAVARDRAGNLAAATSTGGTVAKRRGRVGDSPIVGAGTLADNRTCAISATGDGEGILTIGLTRAISLDLERDVSLERSALARLDQMLERTKARGGVIAIGRDGTLVVARSTHTLSWAFASDDGDGAGI